MEQATQDYVSKVRTNLSELRSEANNHFTCQIAHGEQEEENHFYRIRRKREKAGRRMSDVRGLKRNRRKRYTAGTRKRVEK